MTACDFSLGVAFFLQPSHTSRPRLAIGSTGIIPGGLAANLARWPIFFIFFLVIIITTILHFYFSRSVQSPYKMHYCEICLDEIHTNIICYILHECLVTVFLSHFGVFLKSSLIFAKKYVHFSKQFIQTEHNGFPAEACNLLKLFSSSLKSKYLCQ